MPTYTTIYQMKFKGLEEEITVNISDTNSLTGTVTYIPFEAAESGFIVSVVDNDKDKFKQIRAKQATIRFISSASINAETFTIGDDNRFYVEAFASVTGDFLFKGFLSMDDHNQPFQDPPQVVTLVATDNLGTLKEILLTDSSGNNPRGKNKIIQYIAWALQKTGLQLDIRVSNTWFLKAFPDLCYYDHVYLDAKTFEGTFDPIKELLLGKQVTNATEYNINQSVSCYKTLEMILAFDSFITQYNGTWWIGHIDEYERIQNFYFVFDYLGAYQIYTDRSDLFQIIGKTQPLKFVGEQTDVNYTRACKFVRLTYPYETPKEIIDNIDFSRGNVNSITVDPATYGHLVTVSTFSALVSHGQAEVWYKTTDTGFYYRWNGVAYYQVFFPDYPSGKAYDLADWTMLNNSRATTSTAYIVRTFQDANSTYEIERFVRITPASTAASPWDYIRSNPIPVGYKDKATVSVDFRYESDYTKSGATGRYIFTFYILGEDGHYYCYRQADTSTKANDWHDIGTSLTGSNFAWLYQWNSDSVYEKDYQSVSVDLPAFPITGNLFIGLYNGRNFDQNSQVLNYSNLQFNYQPYINNSYNRYTGLSRMIQQTGNYKAYVDDRVYISDGIRPVFKGTMFKDVSGIKVMTSPNDWFYGAHFYALGTVPTGSDYRTFFHFQIFALWNQNNRIFKTFEARIKGLRTSELNKIPDTVQIYSMDDGTGTDLPGKQFIVSHMEEDFDNTDNVKMTLIEVNDTNLLKDTASAEIVRYIGDY